MRLINLALGFLALVGGGLTVRNYLVISRDAPDWAKPLAYATAFAVVVFTLLQILTSGKQVKSSIDELCSIPLIGPYCATEVQRPSEPAKEADSRAAFEAKRAALDADRQQSAAQKRETERAEEARRSKEAAEDARIKALASLPQMQNGKLISVAGLRVQLLYGSAPDDLQAGRRVRALIRRLNGTVVPRGDVGNVDWTIGLRVERTESIGSRHGDVTLSLDCRQPGVSGSCFTASVEVNGRGNGPNFDLAVDRAIDDAIAKLELQLARNFANRP